MSKINEKLTNWHEGLSTFQSILIVVGAIFTLLAGGWVIVRGWVVENQANQISEDVIQSIESHGIVTEEKFVELITEYNEQQSKTFDAILDIHSLQLEKLDSINVEIRRLNFEYARLTQSIETNRKLIDLSYTDLSDRLKATREDVLSRAYMDSLRQEVLHAQTENLIERQAREINDLHKTQIREIKRNRDYGKKKRVRTRKLKQNKPMNTTWGPVKR